MQQAVGLAFGKSGGLLTVDDIVRNGGDFGGELGGGDETFECADAHDSR
jgi:hypothetical protein